MKAIRAKIKVRADRREEKRTTQELYRGQNVPRVKKPSPRTLKQFVDRSALLKNIVTLLGQLDAKLNGKFCRLGAFCPAYPKIGLHHGELAYHIEPQSDGIVSVVMRENVVWACAAANEGERWHRGSYATGIHVHVFGIDRLDRIRAKIQDAKKNHVKYSTAELWEMREQIKRDMGS